MLPNFICPGAQKCGTTTLQRVLNQHPDIYLSSIKELRFFLDAHYSGRTKKYERFFKDHKDQRAVGDITPDYMFEKNAAQRIYDMLGPDIKLVFMLRNPANRAFSQYRMHERSGTEKRSFPQIVQEEINALNQSTGEHRYPGYVARGLYAQQIKRFADIFPEEHMKIIVLEELISQPDKQYQDIFRFLGVDENVDINFSLKSNNDFMPSHKRLYSITTSIVGKTTRFVSRFMSESKTNRVRKVLRKIIVGHGQYAPIKQKIDTESKKILIDFYQSDIKELESLTGRDFSIWT